MFIFTCEGKLFSYDECLDSEKNRLMINLLQPSNEINYTTINSYKIVRAPKSNLFIALIIFQLFRIMERAERVLF